MSAYVLRGVPWGLLLSRWQPPSWAMDPAVLAGHAGRLTLTAALCAVWTAFGRLLLKPLRPGWVYSLWRSA